MRAFDHIATLRTHFIHDVDGVETDSYFDLDGIELYETRLGWVDKAGRRFCELPGPKGLGLQVS